MLPEYFTALAAEGLPVERGKDLTKDDQIRRWVILQLMCRFHLNKAEFAKNFEVTFEEYFEFERDHLNHCIEDGLIETTKAGINVTDLGKLFIRNVCMGFDWYLRQQNAHRRFSRTV